MNENENQTLGQLQMRNGKIMEIKQLENGTEITFAITTGDVFFGTVACDFEGAELLEVGDITYLEYFEYAERARVEFEVISKLDRAAIQSARPPKNAKEEEFFTRRERAIQSALKYRALFVDSDRTGLPVRAFFLMEDNSLNIINYKPDGGEDVPDSFQSAREYLKHKKDRLERAGETDAIKQLADYLATSN